jgi:hypothetical protein
MKNVNGLGHVACIRATRNAYRVLVGNLKEEPMGRPRNRWEDIKMI